MAPNCVSKSRWRRGAQGEVTLVVEGAPTTRDIWSSGGGGDAGVPNGEGDLWETVKAEVEVLLQQGVSVMSASRTVAKKYGLPRGRLQARVEVLQASLDHKDEDDPCRRES
jgi:hypothetical protein